MIYEIGIYINGVLISSRMYSNSTNIKADKYSICALISALETFYKTTFSQELEYFKGEHHILVYSKKNIKNSNTNEVFNVVAYLIGNNGSYCADFYVDVLIRPKLEELLRSFEVKYGKYNIETVNKSFDFARETDDIFAEILQLQCQTTL